MQLPVASVQHSNGCQDSNIFKAEAWQRKWTSEALLRQARPARQQSCGFQCMGLYIQEVPLSAAEDPVLPEYVSMRLSRLRCFHRSCHIASWESKYPDAGEPDRLAQTDTYIHLLICMVSLYDANLHERILYFVHAS